MMQNLFFDIPFLVIAITSVVSFIAFQNSKLMLTLLFHEHSILKKREWYRLISHALVHGNLLHLIFNMMTLFFFAPAITIHFGSQKFLLIYICSILVGSLLSLFIHRNSPDYRAVGASGGVVGILFASIAIFPFSKIMIFPFPFGINGWIFAVLYLSFTIYSMKYMPESQIGHDAHLGGAIAGIVAVFLIAPSVALQNSLYLFLMMIPVAVGAVLILKDVSRK